MRKFAVLFVFTFLFGSFALAQMEPKPLEVPKTEFYVGYAFQHADTSGSTITDSTNLNGFAIEFSHYLRNSNFGYTLDVSRGSNKAVDSTGIGYVRINYLGGVTYRLHNYGFITPSVHALAGVDHSEFNVPYANNATVVYYRDTAAAASAGVTVDGNLSRHVAIRLGQVDYLYTHNNGSNQNSFRYTAGVVFRF